MIRYAALCSGIGGLELAVEALFDCELAWHAEIDKDAAKVHDRHWPDVPNVGDITAADWTSCEPVELMCFGFPCQDLSSAGKGAGIEKGTRSGLWYDCLDAVRVVRPRVVVIENVSTLVTRRDGLDFTIVMSGLAEAGFDAEWVCVRASDVGAPHRRERVFILAWDRAAADASGVRERPDGRLRGRDAGELRDGSADVSAWPEVAFTEDALTGGDAAADTGSTRREGRTLDEADSACTEPDGRRHAHAGGAAAPDAGSAGLVRVASCDGEDGRVDVARRDDSARRHPSAAHADDERRERARSRGERAGSAGSANGAGVDWGEYEPAVRRWESLFGRDAPFPTDSRNRLSPEFVEWMLGYPQGWVTDTPTIRRTVMLRLLGNSVQSQQAEYALRLLLERIETGVNAA